MERWSPEDLAARLDALAAGTPNVAPPPRRAAVAVALALDGPPRVLLMRRAAHPGDPWSGQVSLPGGGHEPEDADLLATAVRETREEVGVDLGRDARLVGALEARRARARGAVLDLDVTPFVFTLERAVEPAVNEEAEEAFWLPLDRVLRGELDHAYAYRHTDGRTIELPSWRFEERVIWGMTHRILSDLLAAVHPR
jgi:8-oxo-dGTP pyrophosphatase MutT (NUDIX family)